MLLQTSLMSLDSHSEIIWKYSAEITSIVRSMLKVSNLYYTPAINFVRVWYTTWCFTRNWNFTITTLDEARFNAMI